MKSSRRRAGVAPQFSDEGPEFTSELFALATSIHGLLPTPGFLACGQPWSAAVGGNQKTLWITSGWVVFCLCMNLVNMKISQD
jgi:hypothetical protein